MKTEVDWSDYARSFSMKQDKIIGWIMRLYLDGQPFDVDPTYSKGVFWRNLPAPRHRFDLAPQSADVTQADARALPLDAASVQSIMFDPPFVLKAQHSERKHLGIIEKRFSGYANKAALLSMYTDSLKEFHRVLRPGGIVAFKCQDTVSSGRNHFIHADVLSIAEGLGYRAEDLFVLGRNNAVMSPNMVNQKHARKFHSYFWVFRK